MERVRPVWPPSVESRLSGCSFSMMRLTRVQGQRFDIDVVGHGVVGHDGGGVGVDQDDLQALLLQRAAGLGARVVKFGGLTDDDRAGADDHDFSQFRIQRHCRFPPNKDSMMQ